MDCARITPLLAPGRRALLDPSERDELDRHVASCPRCTRARALVDAGVAAGPAYYEALDELSADALEVPGFGGDAAGRPIPRWAVGFGGFVLGVAATALLTLRPAPPTEKGSSGAGDLGVTICVPLDRPVVLRVPEGPVLVGRSVAGGAVRPETSAPSGGVLRVEPGAAGEEVTLLLVGGVADWRGAPALPADDPAWRTWVTARGGTLERVTWAVCE